MDNEYFKICANVMNNDIPFVCDELGISNTEFFETVEPSKISYMIAFAMKGKIQKSNFKFILSLFYQGFSFIDALVPYYIEGVSEDDLSNLIDEVIAENADQYEKFKKDEKLVNWFVGQVMKKSKTKLQALDVKSKLLEKR